MPATIGALPVAVAQAEGILVGYLPGLAMRRIADLHAGHAKTDPRDAFIIAQAARTLPHALRSINIEAEAVAELGVLCGFDEDIVKQINHTANRLRGLPSSPGQPAPRRRPRTTATTISTTPTTSTIGPTVAQTVEPLMAEPPITLKPCRVQTSPRRTRMMPRTRNSHIRFTVRP